MAEQVFNVRSGFFDSVDNDRLYTADDMNKPYKRIVANGVFATPQGTPSTDLQVLSAGSGRTITVKAGEGIFADKWFQSPTDITITVAANTTVLPRRDSVIVQVDKTTNGRMGRIVYREGTPASSPQPPSINTIDNIIEYRIANIYVASGAVYLAQDAIVDLRGSSECLWVTGLIQQVDTSTLYAQWEEAYQNYYETETEAFNAFMQSLTEQLTVNTNIATYESHFTVVTEISTVPINIANFNKAKDVLIVYVNGWRATPGVNYTIDANGQNIILVETVKPGNTVNFLVLQSVVVGDTATVLQELQTLNAAITALQADSGWVNFTLENSVLEYSSGLTPGLRKYNNQVFLRGCIKNVTAVNTVFATLPIGFRPAMARYYAVSAGSITVTIEIGTNGQLKIANVIGTLTANSLIPIDTNFIVG